MKSKKTLAISPPIFSCISLLTAGILKCHSKFALARTRSLQLQNASGSIGSDNGLVPSRQQAII